MHAKDTLPHRAHRALTQIAATIALTLAVGAVQAVAATDTGEVILSEDFNNLQDGPVVGQGNWKTMPGFTSPHLVLFMAQGEAPGLALAAPPDNNDGPNTAALLPLESPLDGSETIVIEYDILRRTSDFLQVGFARGTKVLPGIETAGGVFVVRNQDLQVEAIMPPVPGEPEILLKYGNLYRVRTTWDAENQTVRVEYKNLTEGEETFHTVFFDNERKTADYAVDASFGGADALFVRMPTARCIEEARATNPRAESSLLDNIRVSILKK